MGGNRESQSVQCVSSGHPTRTSGVVDGRGLVIMIPTASHIPTVAVSSRSKVQQRSCAWCAADEGAAYGWLRAQFVDRPDLSTIETRCVCVCVYQQPASLSSFPLHKPPSLLPTQTTCARSAINRLSGCSPSDPLSSRLERCCSVCWLLLGPLASLLFARSVLGGGTPHPVQAIALGRHTFRLTHLDVAGKREDRVDNLKQEHRIAY